jgi:histidine triad (HIT) family protein
MKPCAFCAVVAGDAAAHVVHSDEGTVAFLDAKPVFPGHVLLVPRLHVTTMAELPAEQVPAFFALAQRLESAVETAMDAPGSLVLVNNVVSQSVPHLHLHVIPRRPKDGLRFFLGPRHPYRDTDEAAAVAQRIGDTLRSDGTTPAR